MAVKVKSWIGLETNVIFSKLTFQSVVLIMSPHIAEAE
jgi:hypothetical protein